MAINSRVPKSLPREALASRLARSAACRDGMAAVDSWVETCRARCGLEVQPTPLDELERWSFAPDSGDLVHTTGRFFAIRGLEVRTTYGRVGSWAQPIIHQPEEGILGFLAREVDGVLHFLAQAKAEPGNVDGAQVAPTVQATRSNYLGVHNGSRVPFLEHFVGSGAHVLVDVPQSENGSWFLGKRNRNMVVEVRDEIEHDETFAWLTLGQLQQLLLRPNVVNMDARSVLSCLGLDGTTRRRSDGGLSQWLAGARTRYALSATLSPLRSLPGWGRDHDSIRHSSGKYFRIVGVSVSAPSREVQNWCQPLLEPAGEGLAVFVIRRIDGVPHLLARADVRPGYRKAVEIGPTVQCTPRNFADGGDGGPELLQLVMSDEVTVHYDVRQSEEGGRFHHAVTRHRIVEVEQPLDVATGPDYFWLKPVDLQQLLASSCDVDIEARSLLACLQVL